ncbi:uncharacterized protein BJ212DRAFT_1474840 [Suillus subaureus]|uniref:Uncharacterized protein n=1 Tax=Suillus subaureus TaxID=48587 RepID=A0A9P7EMJ7_9AGAM|nr:uncharacterized protein BJ212DRAFT_1474840 [Suillus subaureus]KAG1825454.1 hypothetical protein BJ212DRAFT_1474840 [Suillus subaureus]
MATREYLHQPMDITGAESCHTLLTTGTSAPSVPYIDKLQDAIIQNVSAKIVSLVQGALHEPSATHTIQRPSRLLQVSLKKVPTKPIDFKRPACQQGINNLWELLEPAAKTVPITSLVLQDRYVGPAPHLPYVVGVDASGWFEQCQC